MDKINDYRNQIDTLDSKIVDLYLERMQLSKKISEEKSKTQSSVLVPGRESQVINNVTKKTEEDDMKIYIKQVYETIMQTSKAYQNSLTTENSELRLLIENAVSKKQKLPVSARVACQGVDGSYSKIAAEKLFEIPDVTFFKTFDAVFSAVEKGLCSYGILPIENSNTGSISQVYDLMRKHKFYIVESVRVQVKHSLCTIKGADIKDLKVVYSHEQGLMQCAGFIKKLGIETKVVENTAVAARMVAESQDKTISAICSPYACDIYGLNQLCADVQDNAGNYTRFICVAKDLEIYKNADKISVLINIAHTPGSLNKLLNQFAVLGLNLTKLESRPTGSMDFEFTFYFDFQADIEDKKVINLICELDKTMPSFVFLGSYKEKL